MSRRLRLALLLVAMAAAGPSASAAAAAAAAAAAFDTGRTQVAIAWFRANSANRPLRLRVERPIRISAHARVNRIPRCDDLRPGPFRLHSLFQRPPPLS